METFEQSLATAKQIQTRASGYILSKLGDFLWAGEPVYDAATGQWSVPVHSRALPDEIALGQIKLDADGRIVEAPSRGEIRAARQRQQPSPEPPRPSFPLHSGFAFAAPDAENPEPDSPELGVEQIAAILAADETVHRACSDLILALANPTYREMAQQAVAAFASAARTERTE